MRVDLFSFEVLVHGRPVREYLHESLTFVEGRKSSEFTLRVSNRSQRRVVVIISVDGLSVMTGKTATTTDSGYVLDAFGSVEIPGWRLDDRAVAHFLFDSLPQAYASQMGKPDNIGVIGAAFFYERQRQPMYEGLTLRGGSRGGFGTMRGDGTVGGVPKGIGTGFGRETQHEVTRVQFDRESEVAALLEIRYDTAEGLRARGIVMDSPHQQHDRVVEARPFPGDDGCPPPPGWRR